MPQLPKLLILWPDRESVRLHMSVNLCGELGKLLLGHRSIVCFAVSCFHGDLSPSFFRIWLCVFSSTIRSAVSINELTTMLSLTTLRHVVVTRSPLRCSKRSEFYLAQQDIPRRVLCKVRTEQAPLDIWGR